MDLLPFQHRRFVSFSDTSNFYRSQPNRLPAPPPPPQPPPPTIPSLPPPPLLPPAHHPSRPPPSIPPPSQPQFSFRPNPSIEERALQLSNFVPAHHLNQPRPLSRLPSPPRVSSFHHNNRSQSLFDDNTRFSDPWPELPLLSRVPPEPPLNHNNRPEVFSPLSPYTGDYRNSFQSSLRFKEEYMRGGFRDDVYPRLPLWGRKETHLEACDDVVDHEYSYGAARERYEWNSGRGNRDFVSTDQGADFSLNPSRVFDIDLRSHYSSMENERKHGHNSADLRGERPELYKDSGFEDLSRSNCNRGGERRADSYFNSSPRKKHLHKKSVLQRIQLGKGNNNNRNRRHDHNHLSESYHDESNSVGGGNFKGKEIDINSRLERKIEDERENSPMELDVLFKSNALIAKAVKATPSPNIELNKDLVSRNRKIRKINFSDSPGTGLNENLEGTESSIDFLDKDLREFGYNVLADKTDRSVLESQYSELSNECQKSSENVTADSSIPYLDISSNSDKDLGKFTNKIKATFKGSLSSSGGLEPCSGTVGNAANKESPKSVEYDQIVKGVESDGKRKRITSPLQTKGEGQEQTSFECLSADTPSEVLFDEGLSSSDGVRIMSAVASDFRTVLVVDEKVKSPPVGDLKKHDIVVNSTKLPLHQSSEIVSVLENYWDTNVCQDGLNSDNRAEHSFQEGSVVFKSRPDAKVMDSVVVNAAKGNKFHDTQMEECRPSSSEQRLGRVSKKIDVAPSMNVNSEVSLPNQEDYTIVEGSPNPISCGTDILCVSPSKIESVPRENTASFNSNDHFRHGCVDTDSQGVKIDSVGLNRNSSTGDEFCEINLPCMEDFASSSNSISLNVDSSRVFSSNSADRLVHGNSGDAPSDLVLDMQNSKSSQSDELSNRCSGKQKIFTENPISGVDSVIPASLSSKIDIKLGQGSTSIVNNQKMLLQNSNSLPDKSTLSNNCPNTSMHGGLPGRASVKYPTAGKAPSFNLVSRSRTWHRTGSPSQSVAGPEDHVTSQISLQEETGKGQNTYVRKGNSLVRKRTAVTIPQRLRASSPSMYHSNPGMDNLKKIRRSENDVNISEPSTLATTVECGVGPERPKTPPLIGTVKLNCIHADHEDSACPQTDPFRKNCPGEKLDPSYSVESTPTRKSMEEGLSSGIKEHEDVSRSNVNCQCPDVRNSGKKITYVKRKSNQLVAFSNSSDPSFKSPENPQPLTSDAYYKRRNNQLIRTSVEDNPKQQSVIPCKILSSQRQEVPKNTQNRHPCKRQTGFTKKKFSLVWTLHETLSSKKGGDSRPFRTVRPFLFPWRRATYWASFKHSSSSSSNDNLASGINRKLLLSRKNDTIYKKSFSGFSLRRSKVLSFCGRSLKWSKSMERNSRKANEDGLQAVVAAEKRKGEQNGASFTIFKSRNYVSRKSVYYCIKLCPGKWIFRIGSERYRMDPTRKTLQRISDEKLPYSEDRSRNKAKKFFVPTRLLIGNDEYVRIGNGNQLVRDPKKRTRTLANEKVRWSLHTARMRLARKKKFCQFFTRFGKCNKDDKRCPYIHDPSKIAVCTKFLNGCCFDSNCMLTHEVIPERMQDCSYFLQGFCSNESCPYRHVNVNPKSPVCEGFLRGYCADGNECRKKHTYVCPAFEATGNCQQGVTCKLHHPKTKKKGAKSKALLVQKNARGGGRYFGVPPIDIATNSAKTVPKLITGECDDQVFCQDGKFKDFISLGDSDDDVAIEEPRIELMSCDSDKEEEPLDMEVDFDELIKPVRLMKPLGNVVFLDSSPTIDITGGSSVSGSPLQMR